MKVLGIDPGLKGALVIRDSDTNKLLEIKDMPVVKDAKGRVQLDIVHLSMWIGMRCSEIDVAILEDVHTMPKDGKASAGKFMHQKGALEGVLASHFIDTLKVKPEVWKVIMGLGNDKKRALSMASATFPDHKEYFKRAKDDGRAEAALLALFGDKLIAAKNKGVSWSSLKG